MKNPLFSGISLCSKHNKFLTIFPHPLKLKMLNNYTVIRSDIIKNPVKSMGRILLPIS